MSGFLRLENLKIAGVRWHVGVDHRLRNAHRAALEVRAKRSKFNESYTDAEVRGF